MSDISIPLKKQARMNVRMSVYVVAAIAALALPFVVGEYVQYIVNLILVYGLVAVGFNIVLGYLGQLAFANTAFFGVGAYALGILMDRYGVPFWMAIVPAGLAGGLTGLIIGLPALRLKGYYLAIVTLALGEMLRWGYIHGDTLTHGSSGLAVPPLTLPFISIDSDREKYFVILVVVSLVLWATSNLVRSRVGRAWVAIRENDFAAASLGFWPAAFKVGAFAWSGFVVGIAGALFAALLGRISPESFNLHQLLLQFSIVMLGGLGSIWGSLLGALLLTAAPEIFRNIPGAEEITFSLLLIASLLFMPRGLISVVERLSPRLRAKLYKDRT